MLLIVGAYIGWIHLAVGARNDHYYLLAFSLVTFYAHPVSRKVIIAFIPFFIYWLLYDSMRIYPNFLFNPVHIAEPYDIEKAWFGISTVQGVLTPNEWFDLHTHPVLDFVSGLFYLCWIPIPIAYGVWLYFKDKHLLAQFSIAFLLVNIVGIAIYYLYPAAPPWYVAEHGFELIPNTPGNAAGLLRFDELTGLAIFGDMYNKNANVFAAIPSLHAAFPTILLVYGLKKGLKYTSLVFFIILVGIWFAAIYTYHHYIIDVALGGFIALITIAAFDLLLKNHKANQLLQRFVGLIS